LLGARPASAQFIELLTEAPATFAITLTTTATSTTGAKRETTSSTLRISQADVIAELRSAGIIPSTPAEGWSLVAVRAAPADLAFVDGSFHLYAVNGNLRLPIPSGKFSAQSFGAAAKYKERHLGHVVLSSSGTVTNHVSYSYLPKIGGLTFSSGSTDGFATIGFNAKDDDGDLEAFFYKISSLRAATRGSYLSDKGQGLMTINLSLGAAKLVPASNYPGIDFYTSEYTAE